MSYCRWSTDDFLCDLYVYESVGGFWSINVAGVKRVYHRPLPPYEARPFPAKGRQRQREWVRRMRARDKARNKIGWHYKPIGGPHDGESFNEYSLEAAIARCEQLRAEGYRFPDYVLDELREELDDDTAKGVGDAGRGQTATGTAVDTSL